MACKGQHVGCPACMTYYLERYANSCTYAKPQTLFYDDLLPFLSSEDPGPDSSPTGGPEAG